MRLPKRKCNITLSRNSHWLVKQSIIDLILNIPAKNLVWTAPLARLSSAQKYNSTYTQMHLILAKNRRWTFSWRTVQFATNFGYSVYALLRTALTHTWFQLGKNRTRLVVGPKLILRGLKLYCANHIKQTTWSQYITWRNRIVFHR